MTFGMFDQLITSASALDLYRQYYSNMSFENLAIALFTDPTFAYQKLIDDPNWDFPEGSEERMRALSSAKFGKYTKQILLWFKDSDFDLMTNTTMTIPASTMDRDDFKALSVSDRAAVFMAQASPDQPHSLRSVRFFTAVYMLLTVYNDCLKYLPEQYRSINQFRTFPQFATFMTAPDQFPKFLKESMESTVKQDIFVYYEDDNVLVLTPRTHFASKFFCGFTEWCTANPRYDSNYFNQYSGEGTLVAFVDKQKRLSKSFQVYIPNSDSSDDPDIRNGRDERPSDDEVAVFMRANAAAVSAVDSELGCNLEELLGDLYSDLSDRGGDQDDDDPASYEAVSGYVFDPITYIQNPLIIDPSFKTMATVKIIPEIRIYRDDPARFDYDESDTGDYIVLTMMPFDLSLFDNSLAAFPEIDFTVPGMVVVLNKGNRHDFQQSYLRIEDRARNEFSQNGDLTIDERGVLDSSSFSEEEQAALGFIEPVHPGDTDFRTFQFSSKKVLFVMFIGIDEDDALLADNDYIIKEYLAEHGIGVGNWYDTSPGDATTVPINFNGKEVEAGVIYRHDTMVTNLYDAMENSPAFAKFMAGEGVISTPMQRKTSKQQDFRFENRAPQKRK